MSLHDRISHRLKLRDLRLLLALNEWGSMAKAANHLNLTQSAVSKAITELEHTFGVRLFDRTSKGIEPTAYGQRVAQGQRGRVRRTAAERQRDRAPRRSGGRRIADWLHSADVLGNRSDRH